MSMGSRKKQTEIGGKLVNELRQCYGLGASFFRAAAARLEHLGLLYPCFATRSEIEAAGYFPDLVEDAIVQAVAWTVGAVAAVADRAADEIVRVRERVGRASRDDRPPRSPCRPRPR